MNIGNWEERVSKNNGDNGPQTQAHQRNAMNFGMGYGGMGYGGMGMGMGMGMGYGMNMLSPENPLSWLYSLNYMFISLNQIVGVIGMNSHALYRVYLQAYVVIEKMLKSIRTSKFRRWLQRKSQKSALLRFLFMLSSMFVASQVLRAVSMMGGARFLQDMMRNRRGARALGGSLRDI